MPTAVPSRPRTILLAAPRSFCAGVERAIEVVERMLAQPGGPVYVRKQIVHNAHMVADLAARGAVFVDELDEVPDGATVVFSAHGVSPAVRAEADRRGLSGLRERGLEIVSCPSKGQIFVRGEVVATVPESRIVATLLDEAIRRFVPA